MHMDMIFTDRSFEDPDVLSITDLDNEFSTPLLKLAFENVVAILRNPDDVNGQPGNRMPTVTIFCHMLLTQAYRTEKK